jgi:choline dehydrogenase-like flavoprotein
VPLISADVLAGDFDVCIVGAGPAGLACAFACHDRGLNVLVLDAGKERPVPGNPDILAAEIADKNAHDPVEIVAASALGGSSHWWGGRSVPLDPIDLRTWPITWDELLPWWRCAAELIGAGAVVERPAPGKFASLTQFHATATETWSPIPVLAQRWRKRIARTDGPAILLRARVTGMHRENGAITALDVLTPAGRQTAKARRFVLACGGLGGIRLMLLAQKADPSLFGGPSGPLGRGYMGHLSGSISDLVFDNPADADAFGYFNTGIGYMARRRLLPRFETVEGNGIGNTAFWLSNPTSSMASHGSALVSARFLAATTVRLIAGEWGVGELPPLSPHFANVGRAPWSAVTGLAGVAWTMAASRITKQNYLPRRFLTSGGGGWRLVYHAEQRNDPSNRISLGDEKDSVGLPKLRIDFRFKDHDAAAVVRTHELLDEDLRKAGAGKLRWTTTDPQAGVAASARDGYHQIGGAVMSAHSSKGVVDPHCRVHDLENLWIASSSVFPTSGQANPTLTIMALSCRIADQIALAAGRPRMAAQASPISLAG